MSRLILTTVTTIFLFSCDGPKVPHPITDNTDESCLSCHRNGDNDAPKMSHDSKSNCIKCHE